MGAFKTIAITLAVASGIGYIGHSVVTDPTFDKELQTSPLESSSAKAADSTYHVTTGIFSLLGKGMDAAAWVINKASGNNKSHLSESVPNTSESLSHVNLGTKVTLDQDFVIKGTVCKLLKGETFSALKTHLGQDSINRAFVRISGEEEFTGSKQDGCEKLNWNDGIWIGPVKEIPPRPTTKPIASSGTTAAVVP